MTNITINDLRPRAYLVQETEGNRRFDFPFPILRASDLRITIDDGEINASGVTVNGVGESEGGHIILATAPAVGAFVTIWRDMAFERTTDFVEDGDFRASAINEELDRMAMLLQQAEALASDAIHHAPEDATQTTDFTLPGVGVRAGKALAFDDNGNPVLVLPDTEAATAAAAASSLAAASAGRAAAAADAAATSLAAAGNPLDRTLNLSDLPDPIAARVNLDVPSTQEVDAVVAASPAVDDVARSNIALNTFRIAIMDGFTILNLVDGIVDSFEDESGTDATLSSGPIFNNTRRLYTTSPWVSHDATANAKLGNMTGDDGLGAAFDGSYDTYSSVPFSSSVTATGNIGIDLGSGNDKAFGKVIVSGRKNTNGDVSWAYLANSPMRVAIEGSDDNSTWVQVAVTPDFFDSGDFTENGTKVLEFSNNQTAYRYWRAVTGVPGVTSGPKNISELVFEALDTPTDFSLVSIAATADADPDIARVMVIHEPLENVTVGSDIKLFTSREAGANPAWVEGTVTQTSSFNVGLNVLEATMDLSGLTAGTDLRWKIETHNNKKQNLHGVCLQWN